jgi:hypothetical protein
VLAIDIRNRVERQCHIGLSGGGRER